jgi:PAP2 superfamily protein
VPRALPCRLTAGTGHGVALLGALALCPLATLVIGSDAAEPIARARALMAVERALGIAVEPAVHAWTLQHPDLMAVAGAFYVFTHVPVAGWALVWTWFLRRDRFRLVRDMFLWTQLLLVSLYVLVPTAPPRLVPGAGYTDTLTTLWGREFAESTHVLQSPFAAVPSGHVAFAVVAGGVFATLGDRGWLRAFGSLYPPLVVAVTVATGNHLLLDAAAAIVVVGAAAGLAARRSPRTVTRDAARRVGRVVLHDGRA